VLSSTLIFTFPALLRLGLLREAEAGGGSGCAAVLARLICAFGCACALVGSVVTYMATFRPELLEAPATPLSVPWPPG
jgi:hypothetical protein